MNIKDIQCFVKVCENRSISLVAEQLYMSPQGVSKIIKRMESDLGVELFLRTKKGIELTEYGILFYEKISKVLVGYSQSIKAIDDLKRQNIGFINMSSAFGVLRILSPDFIHFIEETNSNIHLDYTEFPDSYVLDNLMSGSCDVALVPYIEENPKFNYIPLFSREIYFIVNKNSQFYNCAEVTIGDIMKEPFIIENEHFVIHQIIERYATEAGIEIKEYFKTSGFSLCYKLCREGEGNTVSMDFIFDDMKADNMKMISFREHPKWIVGLVTRKDMDLSENIKIFLKYTQEWCESI